MAIEKNKPEAPTSFSISNLMTNAGIVMLTLKNAIIMQAAYQAQDSIRLHAFGLIAGVQAAYLIYRIKKNQY